MRSSCCMPMISLLAMQGCEHSPKSMLWSCHFTFSSVKMRLLRLEQGRRLLRLLHPLPARVGCAPVRARELGVCKADRRAAEADEAAAAALGAIAPANTVH